jgi:hypothetical protein
MTSNKLINKCGLTKQSHYVLTMSGVFTNSHTVTIGGVVFTFVTALSTGPAVAGEIKIGTAAENLGHLLAVIENPYLASNINYTALSAANSAKLAALKITAQATATTLTIFNPTMNSITVAETLTNGAWTSYTYSNGFALGDKEISLQCISESISSGNGVFTVEVSNDGENFTTYSRLTSNATNTNAQTDTRVTSVTQSTNGSSIVMFPSSDKFAYMRVKVVTTTDGSYSAVLFN